MVLYTLGEMGYLLHIPKKFLSKKRYALGVYRFPQDQQPYKGTKKGQFWWLAKHNPIGISFTHALATYEILIIRV